VWKHDGGEAFRQNPAEKAQGDRKARIEAVAVDIETLLRDNEVHKAYGKLRGWYREKPGHVPKPTFQEEKKARDQFQALYTNLAFAF
jgi:hypothetical protein